jgi:60 kDa SS-A/Ro ribonucleoprotein
MSYLRADGAAQDLVACAARPVDDWARLRRFLILGSAGASYRAARWTATSEGVSSRAAEWTPASDSAEAVARCLRSDGARAVAEIVRVSGAGLAPRSDPALFALAMAAGGGDTPTRRQALDALPRVARTGAQLLRFATFVQDFRGWGRALRRGVGRWYAAQPVDALAHQAVEHSRREGLAHRDVLRLAHPGRSVSAGNPRLALTEEHARLFAWIVRGGPCEGMPRLVEGFVRARAASTPGDTARLVTEYRLPHEAVRSDHLGSPDVWAALLPGMPIAALLRSLTTMTRVGVLAPGSAGTAAVVAALGDADRIRRARLHPIALLAALRSYASGRGRVRRRPVAEVVEALDSAFHAALRDVAPTGRRVMLALDVSESMAWGDVASVPGLTPREASAAMALATAATEPRPEIVGFCAGGWFRDRGRHCHAGTPDGLTRLHIAPGSRLGDAVRAVEDLPFGATDCALPMLYAQALEREVDTFVIYTDSDASVGDTSPVRALRDYRRASGLDARLVVVGMVANAFSIADPADGGMLDVVGFDTATPQLIADFARGAV